MITKKKSIKKTDVYLVLDDSGSMQSIAEAARQSFNKTLVDIQENARKKGQETTVSTWLFGETVEPYDRRQPAEKVREIETFEPRQGRTRLRDAIQQVLEEAQHETDTAILIIVITDGLDNYSITPIASLAQAISAAQATDRVTITVACPPGNKSYTVNALGIPEGNVMEWEQTTEGVKKATAVRTSAVESYYENRAKGKTSTRGFYQVDASKIKARDLKKLEDVSGEIKVFEVEKEEAIAPFVERKTRTPYMRGRAFYQLTKKEKNLQGYKKLLVMKRGAKAVYAGDEAREMLGLPVGHNAMIEPGNLGDFEVFCQSTSSNRKLVRGTKLLVWDNPR